MPKNALESMSKYTHMQNSVCIWYDLHPVYICTYVYIFNKCIHLLILHKYAEFAPHESVF